MAIAVTLTVTPAAPAHGATVTAVYTVTGNAPGPSSKTTVSGDVTVGGQDYQVAGTITMPGTAALPVSYAAPVCPGLSFAVSPADSTGATFTAVVP